MPDELKELDWDTTDAMELVDMVEWLVCGSAAVVAAIAPYRDKGTVLVVALRDVARRIDEWGWPDAPRSGPHQ